MQTDKYVYNAWGKVVSSSGTTANPFRYVGRLGYYYDTETNLYLLGKRYYDADAGVFCQRDKAKDGLSYYAYTSGQSMVAVDPWGKSLGPMVPIAWEAIRQAVKDAAKVSCLKKWYDWWNNYTKENYKDIELRKREYAKPLGIDKIGHCFVSCKGVKSCGICPATMETIGNMKEFWDEHVKGGDIGDEGANTQGRILAKTGTNCLPDCVRWRDQYNRDHSK